MNGRFYDGKTIECFYWDGKTDFKVKYFVKQKSKEDMEIQNKRIEEFGKWLEEDAEEQEQIINKEENIESGVKEIDITEELKKIDQYK